MCSFFVFFFERSFEADDDDRCLSDFYGNPINQSIDDTITTTTTTTITLTKMDLDEAVINCAVNLEWTNAAGITSRKLNYRNATLRLVRNDLREIYVDISTEKTKAIKLKLKDVIIHKKFISEGKASINFKKEQCVLYLSNAPPSSLMYFLRTVFVKLNGNGNGKDEATTSSELRAHLLSGKPSVFNEISPVTTEEMVLARKKAGLIPKVSEKTPNTAMAKKRRFTETQDNEGKNALNEPDSMNQVSKKLYSKTPSSSSFDNIKLCEEQLNVLKACVSGKSVFFTGSAGTGKSYLLQKIISALPPEGTVATASTGVAACLIGGVTLHSFASIGSGDHSVTRCCEMVGSQPVSAQKWRKCKRLIIDEISMVDGQFFDKIEAVARHVRRNERPFGGIQLILCGDFLQLPPVVKQDNFKTSTSQPSSPKPRFCFQSKAWEDCIQCFYELKEVHRQSDPEFVKILNHVRIGYVSPEISKQLAATSKQQIEGDGILATQLCSHTSDANSINESKLESLPGEKILFQAEDSDPTMRKQMDNQLQAPSQLYLKLNAQVMLLKNINVSNGLVNGARGVVARFERGMPVVRFKNKTEYICKREKWIIKTPTGGALTRTQVPLKLGWAFSIHKSQGLTLDCVEMALSKVFEAGQAYVALSRAKSLNSLRVIDFNAKQVWANPIVLQYYKLFRRRLFDTTMIPLGNRNQNKEKKSLKSETAAGLKLKKSIMDKPLVSIS